MEGGCGVKLVTHSLPTFHLYISHPHSLHLYPSPALSLTFLLSLSVFCFYISLPLYLALCHAITSACLQQVGLTNLVNCWQCSCTVHACDRRLAYEELVFAGRLDRLSHGKLADVRRLVWHHGWGQIMGRYIKRDVTVGQRP